VTQEFLGRPIPDIEFVAFDTETTGLVPAHERIVEVSGVRFRGGEELGTFDPLEQDDAALHLPVLTPAN